MEFMISICSCENGYIVSEDPVGTRYHANKRWVAVDEADLARLVKKLSTEHQKQKGSMNPNCSKSPKPPHAR